MTTGKCELNEVKSYLPGFQCLWLEIANHHGVLLPEEQQK